MSTLLLIDDDDEVLSINCKYLSGEGYSVYTASNPTDGLKLIRQISPDCIILDIMMPQADGYQVCKKIRTFSDVPIIFLTGKSSEDDKINGLLTGADDYMVKPFEMLELLVRIEKVLERTGRAKKVLTVRNILVDMQSHQVYKDGLPVSLKPMEYDLFVLLLQNKNIALGREELLKRVWGENYLGESRTVDVHIGQLRKKLELYDEIRTIPKLGYRLEE